jgi:beta-phosphoglucomutase-like phosphatase (HAD superfamily)
VDGTLADTEDMHRRAFNAAFVEQGLTWNWGRRIYAELLKTTGGKERIAHFVDRLRLPADGKEQLVARIPAIHSAKTAHYAQLLKGSAALRVGVARLLADARQAGLKLAIASTTTRANIDALLESTLGRDALGWFHAIAAGDVVERKKPAPDVYHHALGLLDMPAASCIAFEDSGIGLSAAKAAGLFTVVTLTEWTRDDDVACADLVLDDLGEVAGLDYFRFLHCARFSKGVEAA